MSLGGGGGSAPKTPSPVQTNIPQVEQQAIAADQTSYGLSDADFANRFPQLAAGRNYNVADSAYNLAGNTDPQVSGAINKAGLGTPNWGNTEFSQARNAGQPILSKEKRDRNYFQTLLSDNPQRAFGLSGGDVVNLAMANLGAQNQFNQSVYGTRIVGQNQAIAQNAQNAAALYGAIGSLGSAAIKSYGSPNYTSSYLSPSEYGAYNPYLLSAYGGDPTGTTGTIGTGG